MFKKKDRLTSKINRKQIPEHIAIIMDGNGRWAKRRGLPRTAGHREGGKALLKVLKAANDLGVKALTVYAFSTENWKRPDEEVNFLMKLPSQYIDQYLPMVKKENIKMQFIGHLDVLEAEMKQNIDRAVHETKDNTGLIFTIALNYGSHSEMIQAVQQITSEALAQKITVQDITPAYFSAKLMTHDLPPLDLLIRTSGEQRLSNFLLWQAAYSELYFTKTLWPDFDEKAFYQAIIEYQKRHRRYGGL